MKDWTGEVIYKPLACLDQKLSAYKSGKPEHTCIHSFPSWLPAARQRDEVE